MLQAADPTATFGMDLPSPCWQWVLLLTWAPKGASSVWAYLLLVTANKSFPSDPKHLRGPGEGSAGLQGHRSAKLLPCSGQEPGNQDRWARMPRSWGSDGTLRVRPSFWQGQTTEAGTIQPGKGSAGIEQQAGLRAGGGLPCSRD